MGFCSQASLIYIGSSTSARATQWDKQKSKILKRLRSSGVVQRLGALATGSSKGPTWLTYKRCTSSSRGSMAVFWLPRIRGIHIRVYLHTCMQTLIHIKKVKTNTNKGKGCSSVGRIFAYHIRNLGFNSQHWINQAWTCNASTQEKRHEDKPSFSSSLAT